MKRKSAWFGVIGLFLSAALLAAFFQSGEDLFQKALRLERNEGKLVEAIELYNRVVAEGKNESLAAQAQLRIGLCYEKLGQKTIKHAQEAFQKVIDNFPGQTEAVKIAKEKLSTLLSAKKAAEKGDIGFQIRLVEQGGDSSGEISPNNKYLSGVDWDTGDLAIRDMSTGKWHRLTDKGSWEESEECAESPIWSQDSKQIAYTWYNPEPSFCNLRIIGLDDEKPRILYEGDYHNDWVIPYDWSSDSKHILAKFLREEKSLEPGISALLGIVSVENASIRPLKTIHGIDPLELEARFSPDGQYIVYEFPQEENSRKNNIFLLSSDGKQEIPLIEHPADDRLMAWSPDGNWILFTSDRTGTWDAWIIKVSGGKPQEDPQLLRRGIGLINSMGFSQEGSFYYSTPGFRYDIFCASIDTTTGEIIEPARKYPLAYEGHNTQPDLSSDGKYLVYVSDRVQRALCVYSLESGEEREILLKAKFRGFGRPRWISDGQSVLLMGDEIENGAGWHKVEVQTGNTSLIIPHPAWSPAVTPDGRAVYYVKETSKEFFQIMKKDIETGEEKEFYRILPFDNNTLALSPDGKQLALMTMENKNMRELKVLPVGGGEPIILCKFKKDYQVKYIAISWSPDGRYIYFSKQKSEPPNGEWELWRIPSEGGKAQNLKLAMHRFVQPKIHPDGSRITFASYTMHEKVGAVWVMDNFLPKEK